MTLCNRDVHGAFNIANVFKGLLVYGQRPDYLNHAKYQHYKKQSHTKYKKSSRGVHLSVCLREKMKHKLNSILPKSTTKQQQIEHHVKQIQQLQEQLFTEQVKLGELARQKAMMYGLAKCFNEHTTLSVTVNDNYQRQFLTMVRAAASVTQYVAKHIVMPKLSSAACNQDECRDIIQQCEHMIRSPSLHDVHDRVEIITALISQIAPQHHFGGFKTICMVKKYDPCGCDDVMMR